MALETVPLNQLDMNLVFTFTYGGILSPEATQMRLYNDTGRERKITKVRASVGTSCVGGSIVVTILKNGISIFGTSVNEPISLRAEHSTRTGIPADQVWGDGDYLTVSILSVGTSFPGEDLTINVTVTE